MTNPLSAWNAFWFRPVSARPLGAFRIAYGLAVLVHLAFLAPEMDLWLSDAGLLRGTEARELAGPWRPSPLHYWQSPPVIHAVFGATVAVTVLLIAGWRTRVMSALLYAALLAMHHRNLASCSGADVLLVILAFYLMLSPSGAAYSLDARRAARRRGTEAEPLIVPWALRLIQLQVTLLYFMSAFIKAGGKPWLEGNALYYILSNGEVRRFTFGLTQYPLLINALTHGTIVIEFFLAIGLWSRAARPWAILAGVMLHAGIMLTINIPVFGELMMASYLTFLAPDQLDALLRPFARRSARPAAPARRGGVRFDPPDSPRGPHRPADARQLTLGFLDGEDQPHRSA